jgi:hypothetical protein
VRSLVRFALVGLLTWALLAGCSDDGDGVPPVSREDAVAVLVSQGYTEAAAECAIDGANGQDVDILDVFGRDQMTQREYDVMQAVGTFCLQQHGTSLPPSPDTSSAG